MEMLKVEVDMLTAEVEMWRVEILTAERGRF